MACKRQDSRGTSRSRDAVNREMRTMRRKARKAKPGYGKRKRSDPVPDALVDAYRNSIAPKPDA